MNLTVQTKQEEIEVKTIKVVDTKEVTLVLSEREARMLMQVVGAIGGVSEIYNDLCIPLYEHLNKIFPHKESGYKYLNSKGRTETIKNGTVVVN